MVVVAGSVMTQPAPTPSPVVQVDVSEFVDAYLDRPVWFVDGESTVTGDGFRVVAGPLPQRAAEESATSTEQPGTSAGETR